MSDGLVGLHYATILPIASLALAIVAIAAIPVDRSLHSRLLRWSLLALAIGWPVYMLAFLVLDYRLRMVAENTSEGLGILLRLGASWSGGGSSLLLFATLTGTLILYYSRRVASPPFTIVANIILVGVLVSAVANGALATVEDVGGRGLNPLLKSPWVVPHPLATFTGYAMLLTAGLLAASGSYSRRLVLAGFTMLTLGIALGAYWSYETFGWGGYWAWDPVEIAELSVWLAALAMIHSLGPLAPARGAMGMLTASSVMLALYVTRSGLSPLHSFAAENIGSLILLVMAVALLSLFSYHIAQSMEDVVDSLRQAVRRFTLYEWSLSVAGIVSWAAALFVYSSLLFPSAAIAAGLSVEVPSMEIGARFYNPILYPLAVIATLALPGYFIHRLDARGYSVLLASAILVFALLLYAYIHGIIVLAPGAGFWTNTAILAGVSIASASLASIAVGAASRAYKLAKHGSRYRAGKELGLGLLHAGFLLAFLGVVLSWHAAFYQTGASDTWLTPGGSTSVAGFTIELRGYTYSVVDSSVDLYGHFSGQAITAYNAWLALDSVSREVASVVREVLLAGPQSGVKQPLIVEVAVDGVKAPGSIVVDAPGRVYIVDVRSGIERLIADANITLILEEPRAAILETPLVEGDVLQGALLTIGFNPSRIAVEADFLERPAAGDHTVYKILFDEPARTTLEVGGENANLILYAVEVYPGQPGPATDTSLELYEPTLIVADGLLACCQETTRIPATIGRGTYLWLLVERGEARVLKELLASDFNTILDDIGNAYDPGRPALLKLPREAMESVTLTLILNVDNKPVEAAIRFDVVGEALGIHGLVIDVVLVDKGLGDVYISVEPPVVQGYFNTYHEPLIEYVRLAREELSREEYMALLALLAAGYTLGNQQATPAQIQTIQEAILDLYLLAFNHTTSEAAANQGIRVTVKYVPGVDLVWMGTITAVLAGLLLLSLHSTPRPEAKH